MKALGDEHRLRIVQLLMNRELCACELEGMLSMSQSNVSRHLAKLNEAQVTVFRKDAKYSYYRIREEALVEAPYLITVMETLVKEGIYQEDLKKLKKYTDHGLGCDDIKENVLLFLNVNEEVI